MVTPLLSTQQQDPLLELTQQVGSARKLTLKASQNDDDEYASNDEENTSSATGYFTVLLPLLLVYISNQWSRYSLSYLVDFSESASAFKAMNIDIGFSQVQYGTLASVAFTALFAVASLVAGNLADKTDRKTLTFVACLLWSGATLATALSMNYGQLVAARVIMGLMCAFATPCGYTLIRDNFPSSNRALVSSIYGSGVYLGGALASLSILLDNNLGWRVTLETIAAFGAVAAGLLLLLLPSDSKEKDENKEQIDEQLLDMAADWKEASKEETNILSDALNVVSSPRIQLLFLASFLRFCSGLCIAVWGAPYFKMAFPESAQSYAVVNAFIVSLCGVTSGIAGGALADKASDILGDVEGYDDSAGKLAIPVLGSLLAVPAWWFCVHASTFETAMAWLAVEYLVAECWFGPTVAVLQSNVQPNKGGTAQGVFTLVGALANFAPAALGAWYGAQAQAGGGQDQDALSTGLGLVVCSGYFLSAITFYFTAQVKSDVTSAPET
jgi:MFS family permease